MDQWCNKERRTTPPTKFSGFVHLKWAQRKIFKSKMKLKTKIRIWESTVFPSIDLQCPDLGYNQKTREQDDCYTELNDEEYNPNWTTGSD